MLFWCPVSFFWTGRVFGGCPGSFLVRVFLFLVAQGHLCDGGKIHKMAKSARILGDTCATTAPYSHNHVLTCVLY